MERTAERCQAITQAGNQCKKPAQENASYCYIHRDVSAREASRTKEFDALVAEVNSLAEEILQLEQAYTPPPFSARAMVQLLRENLDKFTPEMRLTILGELKESFEGTSARDFLDPDTWKGMWFLLNYSVQHSSEQVRESVGERLAGIPGIDLLQDLQTGLEGASPRDFLDVDTWKGIWYMVNYSLSFEASRIKERLLGDKDESSI